MSPPLLAGADLIAKGVEAFSRNHVYLACSCFTQAVEEERSPRSLSYLGLCRALTGGDPGEALGLCREAVSREPESPEHYLNLGKVLVLAGRCDEAIDVFREGMKRGSHPGIAAELALLGIRKPPVFSRLPRSHPLNKYAGLLLSRLGLR